MVAGQQFSKIFKRFSSTSFIYTFSSVVKAGVQLIVGLVIAKFITPEDYGIWGTLSLFITYSAIFQLGVINATNLELPIKLGKEDQDGAKKLIETGQSYISFCVFLVLIIGTIYLYIEGNSLEAKIYWGVVAIIFIITLTLIQDYLTATFRNPLAFNKLAKINIWHSIVNFITTAAIFYFGYFGLITKSVIVITIYVILLFIYRPFKTKFKFDLKVWMNLVKVGLPIFSLAYLQSFSLSVDRIIILKFSDLESVGIYSFAYLAFSSITMLSASIASYIYPTMTHMYAKNIDLQELYIYLKKNITKIFLLLLFIGIVASLIVPFVINSYFPNYNKSIKLMQILFFAGVFNGSVIGVNVLYSVKDWRKIIIYHLVFSVLVIICPLATIFLFYNLSTLTSVAYGVLVAHFLNFIFGYYIVYKKLTK